MTHFDNENQSYIEDVEACTGLKSLIGKIERFIDADKPKLLIAENGSGKEYLARYIHAKSNRANGPFVAINMASFSTDLLMSELCGYEKGSYSGATKSKTGLFQFAENGTIFLDEINSISLLAQGKLLRILQEREVLQVGGRKPIKINCRIIIATNENLLDMVKANTFRKDLYYRINVLSFTIPPLRERKSDIPILAQRMVSHIAQEKGDHAPVITNEAMMSLMTYAWPGNVRQLYNILFFVVYLCQDQLITADLVRKAFEGDRITLLTYKDALDQFEKELIEAALLSTTCNSETAILLGIGLSTLRDKIHKYGIKTPSRTVRNIGG